MRSADRETKGGEQNINASKFEPPCGHSASQINDGVGEAADAAAFHWLKWTVRSLGFLHMISRWWFSSTDLRQLVAGSPPYIRLKALDPNEGSDLSNRR